MLQFGTWTTGDWKQNCLTWGCRFWEWFKLHMFELCGTQCVTVQLALQWCCWYFEGNIGHSCRKSSNWCPWWCREHLRVTSHMGGIHKASVVPGFSAMTMPWPVMSWARNARSTRASLPPRGSCSPGCHCWPNLLVDPSEKRIWKTLLLYFLNFWEKHPVAYGSECGVDRCPWSLPKKCALNSR